MVAKKPEGYHTVTPTIIVDGASDAIALYVNVFGAKEEYRLPMPDADHKIGHACIQIGDSRVFLCDTNPMMCAAAIASRFYLYMDDVDAAFKKATAAGMQSVSEVKDMFWGDRAGAVKDAFGIMWTLATHVRDVSEDDMKEGMKKMMGQAA